MNAHKFAAAALLGVATATAIPTGTSGAQTAQCVLTAQPWDLVSRKLAYIDGAGRQHILIDIQDQTTPLSPTEFVIPADASSVRWVKTATGWKVELRVGPGCQFLDRYPAVSGHRDSITLRPASVPTTTTVPPATTTTTTAPPPPVTTTAPAPTTTTPGATATSVVRVTPPPATPGEPIVVPTGTILPVTGRRTWAQVRLSIALALAGIGCLAVAKVWMQDEELEEMES